MSAEPLATVEELEKVWRTLDDDEKTRAEALIQQASDLLRLIARNNRVNLDERMSEEKDPDGIYTAAVKATVLASVQRLMAAPIDTTTEMTQYTQSASPYSESMSFASGTTNNLYFKKKELALLGMASESGAPAIGVVRGVH